jgi:ribosomal protein S18 acetylase RimI-like enzyme
LLAAVIERHPRATRMRLIVEAENIKGVSFYRHHGFTVAGEAVEDGVNVLRLEKALRPHVA